VPTWDVGIAVNGTVHMQVEAATREEAETLAAQEFFDDFKEQVVSVGTDACSVEDSECLEG
jgi:hypothetical protein